MSNRVYTLKYATYEVVFREFPDEITLAINISNCPNNCPGCHSSYLKEDIGTELNEDTLDELIEKNKGITCVGFMGGDISPMQVVCLSQHVKEKYPELKTGWYSGQDAFPMYYGTFDYIKLGAYKEKYGPLDNPNTNQRMWEKIDGDEMNPLIVNITNKFWDNKPYNI